jgi:dinuclear metal center YbgI/SA1388 family protein
MPSVALQAIREFLDEYLQIDGIEDSANALNGLQLENGGQVNRIGAAVDASETTVQMAADEKVDLLLVHHGLFWGGLRPMTGSYYRKLAKAISANMAIYSAHLPLDLHPEIGNNVLLARSLQLPDPEPFFFYKGRQIGFATRVSLDRQEIVQRLRKILGSDIWTCLSGPETVKRIGIVTGGAGADLEQAVKEGVDTFITGEGPHHTFALAEELRINLIYGGHYATETFGVRALAEMVAKKFELSWKFLDHPSGL